MKHFKSMQAALPVFKALSAPMRIKIMELLYEEGDKNLNDLAVALGLTNSALSLHTKILKEAGLIEVHTTAGKRGSMKICKPLYDILMIDMRNEKENRKFYEDSIPVGYYAGCEGKPTCGIATSQSIIGEFDDPRYFLFPEHVDCSIFWFASGMVQYTLPNHLIAGQTITQLELSFEISSESPGYNEDYPSDIQFYLNDIYLGYWVSPGDFGARRGLLTPDWWPTFCNQYGLLKTLVINEEGTFIDGGNKISDVKITDIKLSYLSTINFRFEVSTNSNNCGGFTIFGSGFGDYDQGIIFKTFYEDN